MKSGLKIITLGMLLLSGVGFGVAQNNKGISEVKAVDYSSAEHIASYYSSVNGNGTTLLSSICSAISSPYTSIAYGSLKNHYETTDSRGDGYLYDIYSGNTNYTLSSAGSSASALGGGWNKEHTIPKSWWGGQETGQGCDIIIVRLSDIHCNSVRSNYLYAEVGSNTDQTIDDNKFGNCSNYSEIGVSSNTTVFEPRDAIKGDMARTYLYAAARYWTSGDGNGGVKTWTTGNGTYVFSNNGNNGFVQKYLNMLLRWHREDPVDAREVARNANVESCQKNRNPFVDHPSWVDLIWGGTYPSTGTNYENTNGGTATVVNGQISGGSTPSTDPSATISPSSTSVQVGKTINLTAILSNVTSASDIAWESSDTSKATVAKGTTSTSSSAATVTGVAAGNVTINCKYNGATIVSATVTITNSQPEKGTSSNPYTVSEAWTIIDGLSDSANNGKTVYVTGTVTGNVSYNSTYGSSTFDITDGIKTINAYSISGASPTEIEGKTLVGEGYTVIISGALIKYVKNDQTTYEVGYTNGFNTSIYSSVPPKTLSSISLDTTNVTKVFYLNYPFSYSGLVVTANYSDSSSATVDPTSVSSPDMSTTGNKTITVTYTEKNVTRTATYSIEVANKRTVYELDYSLLGTIDYTSDSQVISIASLSATGSGEYSAIDKDYHAWRLGAGSKTGTLTVSSTSSNIYKIVVNARYYGSDSGTTFTIDGTSNTLTSAYADYIKEFSDPVDSINISSVTNGKRVVIQTITVYTKTNVGISSSSDCTGLETFIANYMHMDYIENLGYCKDNTHHYYSSAKVAFNGLNTHQRALFTTNSAYSFEWARLSTWANINGDSLNASNILETNSKLSEQIINKQDMLSVLIVVLSLLSITAFGGFLFIKHKKQQ